MPTRSSKLDLNQLAKSILDQAIGESPKMKAPPTAKQLAGRKGGLKGGKSRMAALTDEQRTALALKGVAGRRNAPAVDAGAASVKK